MIVKKPSQLVLQQNLFKVKHLLQTLIDDSEKEKVPASEEKIYQDPRMIQKAPEIKEKEIEPPFGYEMEEEIDIDEGMTTPDLYSFLILKGVAPAIAEDILTNIKRRLGLHELSSAAIQKNTVLNILKRELEGRLRICGPIALVHGRPKVCAIIGSAGVGKTSTLIKIAGQYQNELQKNVVLISHNQSIEANKLLQDYSEKQNIPFSKTINNKELRETLESHGEADLILIDTPGCNPYQSESVDELAASFHGIPDMEIHLALSAATKDIDMMGAIHQFSKLKFENVIFTKLDETIAEGFLINVCQKTLQGISYLTNGQHISGDLLIANAGDIARNILIQHNTQAFNLIRQMAF